MPRNQPRICECGCFGWTSGGHFLPGHDARLRSRLLRQWRNEGSIDAHTDLERRGWLPSQHGTSGSTPTIERINLSDFDAPIVTPVATPVANNDRTFGIEIECILPHSMTPATFVNDMRAFGINIRETGYGHEIETYWRCATDSSIQSFAGRWTAEIVSPILRGEAGIVEVRKVLNAVNELGCEVNKSCGFHVHIGVGDLDFDGIKRLINGYTASQTAIDAMIAKSRRSSIGNQYCRPWTSYDIETLNAYSDLRSYCYTNSERYKTVNVQCFPRQGTIEFRQRHGTTEAGKGIAWIRFCLAMVETAKTDVIHAASTLEGFLSNIRIDDRSRRFLLGQRDVLEAR